MSYTIESIAEYIGARRVGEHEATIDWLLTDSRSLSFPEETLFFALPTKRNNGARYISELYDRGVRNFVVTEEDFKRMENGECTITIRQTKSTAGEPVVLYVSVQISPERWRRWGRYPRRNRSPGKHRHR